ncbi:hypothetical protein [Flavobacterium terrae]|nr:hypothetical protein [Flavobacterium terrae]
MSSIIYFIATGLRNQELQNIEFIKSDYKITRGIITKKSVTKGRHIRVEYKVGGKLYENSDGFNENDKVQEGDSVDIKYSISKPELMITEFNDEFNH